MNATNWRPIQIAHNLFYMDITASRNDYLHGAPANQDWRVLWAARESLREQRTYRTDFGVVQDTPPDVAYIVPCLRVYVERPQDRVAVERVVLQAARQVLGNDAECDIRMYPEARPRTPPATKQQGKKL